MLFQTGMIFILLWNKQIILQNVAYSVKVNVSRDCHAPEMTKNIKNKYKSFCVSVCACTSGIWCASSCVRVCSRRHLCVCYSPCRFCGADFVRSGESVGMLLAGYIDVGTDVEICGSSRETHLLTWPQTQQVKSPTDTGKCLLPQHRWHWRGTYWMFWSECVVDLPWPWYAHSKVLFRSLLWGLWGPLSCRL